MTPVFAAFAATVVPSLPSLRPFGTLLALRSVRRFGSFTVFGALSLVATLAGRFSVPRARFAAAHFLVAIGHGGFARKSDSALLIHPQALDPDFIPQLHDVLGLLDAEVRQFADMHQPVLAWQEFHKGAKF